jgi:ketosteroid isomerase-like protein
VRAPYLVLLAAASAFVAACEARQEPPITEAERTAIADTIRQLRDSIVTALDTPQCDIIFPVADDMLSVINGRMRDPPSGPVDRAASCWRLNERRVSATDEISDERVHVLSRDAAYIVARSTYTTRWRDGRTTTRPNVATGVWARGRDGWQLVHFHESWPVEEVRAIEPAR